MPVVELDGTRIMYPLRQIHGIMAILGPWDEAFCIAADNEGGGFLYCDEGTPERPNTHLAPESLAVCRMLRDGGWKTVALDGLGGQFVGEVPAGGEGHEGE